MFVYQPKELNVESLSFRARQTLVSIIGAIIIIPLSLHFGGSISFSFGVRESLWAWLFALTAFWLQIFAILTSFFKPRLAAAWMLLNIALSIAIGLVAHVRSGYHPDLAHFSLAQWFGSAPAYLKTAGLFWTAPLLLALFLLRTEPAANHHTSVSGGH